LIGLIALSTDITVEKEFHRHCPLHVSTTRVIFRNPINHKNLSDIKNQLKNVKDNLPDNITQYVFGCTSGTAVIGDYIEENFINPLTATVNWCKEHNVSQIGLFTPYNKDVHTTVKQWFETKGIYVVAHKCLNIDSDVTVANLDRTWLKKQIQDFETTADTIFLSCTALPVLDLLPELTQETGKHYISSNSSLIWQLTKETKE
jgi:maleate isomerase